jgi:hypothetical protein
VGAAIFKLRSVVTGKEIGVFTTDDFAHGIPIALPGQVGVLEVGAIAISLAACTRIRGRSPLDEGLLSAIHMEFVFRADRSFTYAYRRICCFFHSKASRL